MDFNNKEYLLVFSLISAGLASPVMSAEKRAPLDVSVTNTTPIPVEVSDQINVNALPPVTIESLPSVTLSPNQTVSTQSQSTPLNQVVIHRTSQLQANIGKFNDRIALPAAMSLESILITPGRGTTNSVYTLKGDYSCVFNLGYLNSLLHPVSASGGPVRFTSYQWDMSTPLRNAFEYRLPNPVVVPGGQDSFLYDIFSISNGAEFGHGPCKASVTFVGVAVN